jgi:hypothetical protein
MLPRKTGKPIAFKCTEELRQQTEAIADSLGESLSDYVRKAVEMRNKQIETAWDKPGDKEKFENIWGPAKDEGSKLIEEMTESLRVKPKNRQTPKQAFTPDQLDELHRASGHEKKQQSFKTFFKEGKK